MIAGVVEVRISLSVNHFILYESNRFFSFWIPDRIPDFAKPRGSCPWSQFSEQTINSLQKHVFLPLRWW